MVISLDEPQKSTESCEEIRTFTKFTPPYYACYRNLFKNKSPVCKCHSKKMNTSYCHEWVVYGVPNHCELIGATFEVLTFVVSPFGRPLVMTSKI